MARTTVEDCFKKLNNKFELSVLASYRAKQILKGAPTTIDKRNDKNSVTALREIASFIEHIDIPTLRRSYIRSLQLCLPSDDVVEDNEKELNSSELSNDESKESSSISDELIENEFISVEDDGDTAVSMDSLEVDSSIDDIFEEDISEEESIENPYKKK